ncbi:MAG: hypothetical protein HY961_12865 [Ignavibacteriae bacterium]|nr:hypothetical protein [Ignavibacteriota bacterium]
MRFALHRAALVALVSGATVAYAARHELVNVNYRGTNDVSRLVFAFNRPCTFTHQTLSATQMRLSFPRTQSAKYSNRIPLIFEKGHAKVVAFDFSRKDTLSLIVTLNEGTQYDFRSEAGKITMEMYSAQVSASTPLVDIKAMVAAQISQAKNPGTVGEAASVWQFNMRAFITAFILSLLSTGLMMHFRFGKQPEHVPVVEKPVQSVFAPQTGVEAILAQARLILQEKVRLNQLDISPKMSSDTDDATLVLARTFQRGRGELQLAKNLERKSRDFSWKKTVGHLASASSARTMTSTAKKLGVGKGELDLALSLRRVQQQHVRKEHLT